MEKGPIKFKIAVQVAEERCVTERPCIGQPSGKWWSWEHAADAYVASDAHETDAHSLDQITSLDGMSLRTTTLLALGPRFID